MEEVKILENENSEEFLTKLVQVLEILGKISIILYGLGLTGLGIYTMVNNIDIPSILPTENDEIYSRIIQISITLCGILISCLGSVASLSLDLKQLEAK